MFTNKFQNCINLRNKIIPVDVFIKFRKTYSDL